MKPGMLFLKRTLVSGALVAEGITFGAGNQDPSSRRTFAFKEDTDAIPFTYQNMTSILRTFRIPTWSKKAEQMGSFGRAVLVLAGGAIVYQKKFVTLQCSKHSNKHMNG